jgi:hypothetical protein
MKVVEAYSNYRPGISAAAWLRPAACFNCSAVARAPVTCSTRNRPVRDVAAPIRRSARLLSAQQWNALYRVAGPSFGRC